jgi:hypothetical protein
MAKKPESRLQQRIKKRLLAEVGGKWIKLHGGPFQEAGQPDLIGCVDGWFFGFEVKIPGRGKPSPLQLVTLAEWREEGAICCIVENSEEAISVVQAVTKTSKARRRGNSLARWLRRFVCSKDW